MSEKNGTTFSGLDQQSGLKGKHLYTSDEKIKWFGYGEWVEEPDEITFTHCGYECHIQRVLGFEISGHAFGGHLCGYVILPDGHPLIEKDIDVDYDVHGGITYNSKMNGKNFLGFDCAHSFDTVPSMSEQRKKTKLDCIEKFPHIKTSAIFQESYKTVSFVIDQLKQLAEQVFADYPLVPNDHP